MKKLKFLLLFIFSFLFLTSCMNNVTVTFETNCDITLSSVVIKYGQVVDKPSDLEQDDMIFLGWYLNDQPFDFTKAVVEDITLSAKWVVAPEEELEKAQKILKDFENIEGFTPQSERLARALYTYKVNFDYLKELNKDQKNLINELIEQDILSETLAFSLIYTDILLEFNNKTREKTILELTDDLKTKAQNNYMNLKTSGLYSSEFENFLEDKTYVGFILPVLYSSLSKYNKYTDPKIWVHDAVKNKYLEYFDVSLNDDVYTFYNRITKSSFVFSSKNLLDLINAYNKTYNNQTVTLVTYYKSLYKKFIFEENKNNELQILLNNDHKITEIIKNDLTNISYSVEKINNTYNILLGFEEKINSLKNDFEVYENKEDLKSALISALDFKDQVLLELESVLPEFDAVLNFSEIYECFPLESLYAEYEESSIPSLNINLINNFYNEAINLITDLVLVLEEINANNYDIDSIIDAYYNDSITDNPDLIEIENKITNCIENSSFYSLSIYEIIDIIDTIYTFNGISTTNIYEDKLSESIIEELSNIFEANPVNLTKDDITNIVNIIKIMRKEKFDYSLDDIHKYINTVTKLLDSISKESLVLLRGCLVELVYVEYRTIKYSEAENFIDILINNYNGFEAYLNIYTYTKALNNALDNTIYKDLSYSKRNKQILIEQFTYLNNIITDENEELIKTLLIDVNDNTNLYSFDSNTINNLKEHVTESLNLLLSDQKLTAEQKQYINQTGELFDFDKH